MSMRPSRRIRIERGVGPKGVPSVSVDAATAARQYGPLGHDTWGPIQSVGEFYDIRAFQDDEPWPLYHSPAPWFEGLDRPTRHASVLSPRQEPPEMSANARARPVGYRAVRFDFAALMRMFRKMTEEMNQFTYEPFPYIPASAMRGSGEGMTPSPAMEAMIDQIALNEPVHYQTSGSTSEAVPEPMSVFDPAAQMDVAGMAPAPTAEDGLVAFMQSMAEPLTALAEQQQEQATQSLEAMVQDQMSLMGPAPAEDPSLMPQQMMMDMMLLTGFGPGM